MMTAQWRICRRPGAAFAFAALFGLLGGFLLGVAVALPDAFTDTWRGLWLITGLVRGAVGLGVALITAAVWVLIERRTSPDRVVHLVLLPPVTGFLVVVMAFVVVARGLSVLTEGVTWGLAGVAALLAASTVRGVGWQRPRE